MLRDGRSYFYWWYMKCIFMHVWWLVCCSHNYLCVPLLYFQCHPYQGFLKVPQCLSQHHPYQNLLKAGSSMSDSDIWLSQQSLHHSHQLFCHTPTTPGETLISNFFFCCNFSSHHTSLTHDLIPTSYTLPISCKNRLFIPINTYTG